MLVIFHYQRMMMLHVDLPQNDKQKDLVGTW